MNLLKTQDLDIYESPEVVVISEDEDLVFTAFQVVAPSLKDFNNSQKLLIVDLLPSFDRDYFLREKDYWMPLANFGLREIKMIFVGPMIRKTLIRIIRNHLT